MRAITRDRFYLVYLVQLHKAFSVIRNRFGVLYSQDLRAAFRACQTSVHKKAHLSFSQLRQTRLKTVDRLRVNELLCQTVPAIQHSKREEM